ncbi:GLE1-like protein-domain-containing protein [Mycena floridula]|nr:GLE1-like protein-domain-containing protein [Mycena floridula]
MRFAVPRSISPSPVRRDSRRSTFGLGNDSDDSDHENYANDSSDDESIASSSSSSSQCAPTRSPAQQRAVDEAVAAVRIRTRHHDPYTEWERKARKDAFRTARSQQKASYSAFEALQHDRHSQESRRVDNHYSQQLLEVQSRLNNMRLQQQKDEEMLRENWKQRDALLWKRIEAVIKFEEDKVKARFEEEEKKRKAEEMKRRLEEEKKKAEEDAKRQDAERKKKAEEDAKREEEEEKKRDQEEQKRIAEEEAQKQQLLQAEAKQRQAVGMSSAQDDWKKARHDLLRLKTGAMKTVKSDKTLRAEWGSWRRQITPKIGQLTDDDDTVNRISTQLWNILAPQTPHQGVIYAALLSSLAKAIILQAEAEVTAKKESARPLARVAFNLLTSLDGFSDVLFAKLVQRVGGWPIPCRLPATDYDGRPWTDEAEKIKVLGYRKTIADDGRETIEDQAQYATRVSGIMRVYFSILKVQTKPAPSMFQMTRSWTWFARILSERSLLATVAGAELVYSALDVLGEDARKAWGNQFAKVLQVLYEGVTGANATLIGGTSPEGKAARVRVELRIEKILAP